MTENDKPRQSSSIPSYEKMHVFTNSNGDIVIFQNEEMIDEPGMVIIPIESVEDVCAAVAREAKKARGSK